ncbi:MULTISPECIES: universal stress protein [unclassified Pseudonocardia]|uniref:universal stress protein n=1 Tax=unclassified Pseudonocardia TaxID=2619320 RepID=UPI000B244CF2|nr:MULTISPECIES: universal stress protein [unclassified Pseudonocardia]
MRGDQPVVVGVDGSPESLEAVRWAAAEAHRRHLPLRFVSAVQWLRPGPVGLTALASVRIHDVAVQSAEAKIDLARSVARDTVPDLDIRWEVRDGPAASVLRDEADSAAMLVVGNRGTGGFGDLLAGSVSVAVAALARCPVVVVRRRPGPADRTDRPVVVGVDGTRTSESALSFAFAEASARQVGLVAVHVWSDDMIDPFAGPLVDWEALAVEANSVLAERLAGWGEKYPDVTVTRDVVRDNAPAVLVDRSRDAQLVVVGSHGRGRLRGVLLGSVSQAMVRHAHCPVAIVKP